MTARITWRPPFIPLLCGREALRARYLLTLKRIYRDRAARGFVEPKLAARIVRLDGR